MGYPVGSLCSINVETLTLIVFNLPFTSNSIPWCIHLSERVSEHKMHEPMLTDMLQKQSSSHN
jgi:hypothetical protein